MKKQVSLILVSTLLLLSMFYFVSADFVETYTWDSGIVDGSGVCGLEWYELNGFAFTPVRNFSVVSFTFDSYSGAEYGVIVGAYSNGTYDLLAQETITSQIATFDYVNISDISNYDYYFFGGGSDTNPYYECWFNTGHPMGSTTDFISVDKAGTSGGNFYVQDTGGTVSANPLQVGIAQFDSWGEPVEETIPPTSGGILRYDNLIEDTENAKPVEQEMLPVEEAPVAKVSIIQGIKNFFYSIGNWFGKWF
jgi:hypothetical protein